MFPGDGVEERSVGIVQQFSNTVNAIFAHDRAVYAVYSGVRRLHSVYVRRKLRRHETGPESSRNADGMQYLLFVQLQNFRDGRRRAERSGNRSRMIASDAYLRHNGVGYPDHGFISGSKGGYKVFAGNGIFLQTKSCQCCRNGDAAAVYGSSMVQIVIRHAADHCSVDQGREGSRGFPVFKETMFFFSK